MFPVLKQQVARAGRFGTKGLAITFVSDEGDAKVLNDVQERFEVNITELPEEIDVSSYCKYTEPFAWKKENIPVGCVPPPAPSSNHYIYGRHVSSRHGVPPPEITHLPIPQKGPGIRHTPSRLQINTSENIAFPQLR